MAAKDIALKKQLIKEGVFWTVVLIALSAGTMLLSNYDDDAQAEKRVKESENSSVLAEHEAIKQELASGFSTSAFYNAYALHRNGDLVLKRDTATQWMAALREKDHLSNLSVSISPITDATADFGQIKGGTLTKSEVTLSFGALTDNSVYNFMEDLERKLPGIIIFKDITLTRTADPSRDVLLSLSNHKLASLINGKLAFTWLGVRPADEDKAASASSPNKGPAHGL